MAPGTIEILPFHPGLEEVEALAQEAVPDQIPGRKGKVDPVAVANRKGITVSFNDYGQGFDGMLELAGDRFHIYCNTVRTSGPESPRSRFTVAHELGHWFLDGHRRSLEAMACPMHPSHCQWESALLCERQADSFAAALLAPARWFLARARSVSTSLEGLRCLAEATGLSLTATAIRYAQLDAGLCGVFKWSRDGLCWMRVSHSSWGGSAGAAVGRVSRLAPQSPTRRALAGQADGAEVFEAGTTAHAWFGGIQPESPRNILLIEQAVSLGRYGALTFLRPAERGQARRALWEDRGRDGF
jgi:Zn-dependent peptidase ImmA (M78 family)